MYGKIKIFYKLSTDFFALQAPVVQKLDSTTHLLNNWGQI